MARKGIQKKLRLTSEVPPIVWWRSGLGRRRGDTWSTIIGWYPIASPRLNCFACARSLLGSWHSWRQSIHVNWYFTKAYSPLHVITHVHLHSFDLYPLELTHSLLTVSPPLPLSLSLSLSLFVFDRDILPAFSTSSDLSDRNWVPLSKFSAAEQ